MIPLRTLLPTRTKPVATYWLIGINVGVYLLQLVLGSADGDRLTLRFGLIPGVITGGALLTRNSLGGSLGALVTPLTSMFLHGSLIHLAANMWFLWVFGDNVEEALGKARYVAFYLLAGLSAAALQVASDPSGVLPMVGASGAISGVLAGYVVLFPRARIVTLVPLFIFFTTFEIPAYWFILLWFGLQVLNGLSSLADGSHVGGVAWWAHIGGFVGGFAIIHAFRRPLEVAWVRTTAAERRSRER